MTGKGRGRGWLNIEKMSNCEVRPGETIHTISPTTNNYATHSANNSQHEKIVHAISHFNDNDDGILLNQKFRYVKEILTDICQNSDEVENAIKYVYNKALSDSTFISKFVKFVSLNTFQDLTICDLILRYKLITLFQDSYENSENMQATSPQNFRNAIKILTGFYEKAIMKSERNYKMLASPIVHCLLMLLDSEEQEDIELFTTQFYACGPKFIEDSVNLTELSIKIRTVLTANNNCASEISKLWLLLAIDLVNNEFRVLPADLLNFYQMKLGIQDLFNFKKPLIVECTSVNNKLNEYTSDVNVLEINTNLTKMQVTSSDTLPPRKSPNPNPTTENGDMYWNGNKNSSQLSKQQRPKHTTSAGRPILGAGARINANRSDNTGVSNWKNSKEKDSSPDSSGKVSRKSKDWEQHDDRFETGY